MEISNNLNWREEVVERLKLSPYKAIVKVSLKDHIPNNFKIRTKISDTIFTADLAEDCSEAILTDSLIISISLAYKFNTLN